MASAITASDPVRALVPGHVSEAALQAVSKIHQEFARGLGTELMALIQQPASVSLQQTRQESVSEALGARGSEVHVATLDLAPAQARGYMAFSRELLFSILDALLASPGLSEASGAAEDKPEEPPRAITAIELHILRECFQLFATGLRKAWEPSYPLAFELPDTEAAPFEEAEVSDTPAFVLTFVVDIAGICGNVDVVMPAFLARYVELNARPRAARDAAVSVHSSVLSTVAGAVVRFDALLSGASLRVDDLLNLAPGHVIGLGYPESRAVECGVNGQLRFTAELIASGARRGVQIIGIPELDR